MGRGEGVPFVYFHYCFRICMELPARVRVARFVKSPAADVPCSVPPALPRPGVPNAAASSDLMSPWPSAADMHVELHGPPVAFGLINRVAHSDAIRTNCHPGTVDGGAEIP